MSAEPPIWTPSLFRIADANLTRFMAFVGARGARADDCDALYRWSIDEPAAFWEALWDFAGVAGERGSGPALVDGDRMPGARWFPGARLNFAENLLRGPEAEPAIVFRNERGDRREMDWRTLRAEVARIADGLRTAGRRRGRRRRRFPSQPAGVSHRDACDRERRRHLDFLLPRLRDPGRARPVRPGGSPGSCSPRTAITTAARPSIRWRRSRACSRSCHRSPASWSCPMLPPRLRSAACRMPCASPSSAAATRRCPSLACPSTTRSTCCTRAARRACPSASCTAPAARCCNT